MPVEGRMMKSSEKDNLIPMVSKNSLLFFISVLFFVPHTTYQDRKFKYPQTISYGCGAQNDRIADVKIKAS